MTFHSWSTGELLIEAIIGGAIGGALLSVVSHITTNPDATVGSTLLALAVGAVTGAIGGGIGAPNVATGTKILCTAAALIAGAYTIISTDGTLMQKIAAGVSTAVITAVGTYAGSCINTIADTRFGTAVANYSTTILVGSVTEPLSVATQNAVTRNKSNTKTNLRNERYRIWAQRKVGMLLGIQ